MRSKIYEYFRSENDKIYNYKQSCHAIPIYKFKSFSGFKNFWMKQQAENMNGILK